MTYGSIMARIAELIQKGQNGKINGMSNIGSVRGYSIIEEDITEFSELLELENTFYLLNTEETPTLNNDGLLKLCQERASVSNEYTNDYLALIEILNNAYGKTASELSEHLGYYIPKESIVSFYNLCNKLKVGPCTIIKSMTPEVAKGAISNSLTGKRLQFERIKNYMLKHFDCVVERASLIPEKNNSRDFMEIVSLGIDGLLTKEMVASLKARLSKSDFQKLLDRLVAFNVFTNKEILRIESLVNSGKKESLDLDELVVFLAGRKQLEIESLKYLIPEIGIYNYHYVIDELFKLGVIKIDEYIKVIKGYLSDTPVGNIPVENYVGVIEEYAGIDPKR
ncbi:MAG: hypothetical protein E7161_02950 [Firmicutes bacterium]|nr:hypothetical protein [Bacillota bacterium]